MSAPLSLPYALPTSPVHLPTLLEPATPWPPPTPPQQPVEPAELTGRLVVDDCVVNCERSPNTIFCFLPIALSCSPASVARDFFMYSRNAGIATAARMPMIATARNSV